jgi:hypothetical protein
MINEKENCELESRCLCFISYSKIPLNAVDSLGFRPNMSAMHTVSVKRASLLPSFSGVYPRWHKSLKAALGPWAAAESLSGLQLLPRAHKPTLQRLPATVCAFCRYLGS